MPQTSITPKQAQILYYLYLYRYLNRHHLQQLLNHKDDARINKWLKDLTTKHYLTYILPTNTGANTKPLIYYLTPKSIPILKTNPNVNTDRLARVYRGKGRSLQFIHHCLHVADICLSFALQAQEQNHKAFLYPKMKLLDFEYLIQPVPDAYIAIEKSKRVDRYFLEVFDATTPRPLIRKRIQNYIAYAESGEWEAETDHPFPKVVLSGSSQITAYLTRYLARQTDELPVSFSVIVPKTNPTPA